MRNTPPAAITIQRMLNLKKKLKKFKIPKADFFRLWDLLRDDLYNTLEYQTLLTTVRLRARYNCEDLGCKKKGRQVHHEISVYSDPTKALDPDNCKFLCISGHRKRHKGERAARLIKDNRFKKKQFK